MVFCKALRLQLHMASQSLAAVRRSFAHIINYDQSIKEMHHGVQGSNNKQPCQQGSYNEIHNWLQFRVRGFLSRYPQRKSYQHQVNLVGLFRQHFNFQIGVNLVIVVTHRGVHNQGLQLEVSILNQLNFLNRVECPRDVMIVVLQDIQPKCVPKMGC